MKVPLPRQLMLGAALVSVVAGVLIVVGLRMARPTIHRATFEYQSAGFDADACQAAPEDWGWSSGEMSLFAYDHRGRSANPRAPELERELLAHTLATHEVAVRSAPGGILYVVERSRIPSDPCAVLRISTRNPERALAPRFLAVLAGSMVVAMLLAVAGTFWLVVRPLQTRVEGIAAAARGVGTDNFSPPPSEPDALGHIAEVLSRSHGRIVEAQSTLEHRNRALEDHLAGIAHDLRTPLSSMHLALEAVATESSGGLHEAARRALADVVYLSSMVENLHQATRLRHEVEVTGSGSVELGQLVRRLEDRFAIVGRHAHIEVAASAPEREVWAACTPSLAERAVSNVIQNAIEHNALVPKRQDAAAAPRTGHVAITLSLTDDGRGFELAVADDGPGLPEGSMATANLKHETFLLESARRRGPGLGMLITAEVARRAEWTLAYEALEPNGLRVRLTGPTIQAASTVAGGDGH